MRTAAAGALDVSEGDEVLYSKYGGTEVTVEDEELLVLRESDVLAKLGRAPTTDLQNQGGLKSDGS